MADIETRGSSLKSLLAAVEALWGKATLDRVLAACPVETRTALTDGRIVPGGYYPIGWYRDVHAAVRVVLPGETDAPAKIGRQTTTQDLQGFLKWVVGVAGPDVLARFSDRLFAAYFRGGRNTIERSHGRLDLRMEAMDGMTKPMWEDLAAGMVTFFETAAGRKVQMRVSGGIGNWIEISLRWDERAADSAHP